MTPLRTPPSTISSAALLPTPLLVWTPPLSIGLPVLGSTSATYSGLNHAVRLRGEVRGRHVRRAHAGGAHVPQHAHGRRQVLAEHPAVVDRAARTVRVPAGAVPLVVELAHHVRHRLVDRAGLVEVEQRGGRVGHAVGQLVRDHVVRLREPVAEDHLLAVPERVVHRAVVAGVADVHGRGDRAAVPVDAVPAEHVLVEVVDPTHLRIGGDGVGVGGPRRGEPPRWRPPARTCWGRCSRPPCRRASQTTRDLACSVWSYCRAITPPTTSTSTA